MQKRSIKYSKITLSVFVAVCLTSVFSCKEDTSPAQQLITLSGPTVFIPVGLLKSPQGIAVDGAGNVWIADSRNNRVRRFTANATQNDSIIAIQPTRIAIHRQTGDLLVIQNGSTYARYLAGTNTILTSSPLIPFVGDASAAFDVNTRSSASIIVTLTQLGDIDSSPTTGDVFVAASGTPANSVLRIQNGNVTALVFSSTLPADSAVGGARFLALDRFGTVFSSFALSRGPSATTFVYSISPGNITQSHLLSEPVISSAARGATIDNDGNLYIADPLTREMIVVSSSSEKTVNRYLIPDANGYSMVPRDIAVASDGTVYVVVNDRLGTEAGAILKYKRTN